MKEQHSVVHWAGSWVHQRARSMAEQREGCWARQWVYWLAEMMDDRWVGKLVELMAAMLANSLVFHLVEKWGLQTVQCWAVLRECWRASMWAVKWVEVSEQRSE
jgi:hypothetical protein